MGFFDWLFGPPKCGREDVIPTIGTGLINRGQRGKQLVRCDRPIGHEGDHWDSGWSIGWPQKWWG